MIGKLTDKALGSVVFPDDHPNMMFYTVLETQNASVIDQGITKSFEFFFPSPVFLTLFSVSQQKLLLALYSCSPLSLLGIRQVGSFHKMV